MSVPLVPFERITFVTHKPMGEVMQLLHRSVEIRSSDVNLLEAITGTLDVPFYGELEHNHFNIKRKTTFGSKWKVELRGSLREGKNVTFVDANLRFDFLSNVVYVLLGALLLISLISSAFGDDESSKTTGIAASMLFWYLFMMANFVWGSWRVRSRFLELIRGEIHYPAE